MYDLPIFPWEYSICPIETNEQLQQYRLEIFDGQTRAWCINNFDDPDEAISWLKVTMESSPTKLIRDAEPVWLDAFRTIKEGDEFYRGWLIVIVSRIDQIVLHDPKTNDQQRFPISDKSSLSLQLESLKDWIDQLERERRPRSIY